MTAHDIVAEVSRRGGRLEAGRERLLVHPGRVLDDRLRQEIRQRKADLLALIATPPTRPPDPPPARRDWLVYMPSDRFRAGRYLVRLYSEVLGDEIALVSNPDVIPRAKALGLVTYLPEEIDRLAEVRPSAVELRRLHAIKKELDGRIVEGK